MGKGGRCVRLTTLPPSWAIVTKSGNLNFLEPSGPLRACNGTALPLPLLALLMPLFFRNLHDCHVGSTVCVCVGGGVKMCEGWQSFSILITVFLFKKREFG